jgi:hypothetical protein
MTQPIRTIGGTCPTQQAEQASAQRRQRLRRPATMDLPGIFPKRHIAHIVHRMLNRALPPPQRFHLRSARLVDW